QDGLADEGLDLEEEKRREKNRQRVREHRFAEELNPDCSRVRNRRQYRPTMSYAGYLPAGRNYPELFVALDDAIEALLSGNASDRLIQASFENVAEGLGAEKAIALAVAADGSMRALASRGLSPADIEACEAGQSVPGISSSKIREGLERKAPLLVQDPRHLAEGNKTRTLEGQP